MQIKLDYTPQERQSLLHKSSCRQIFYGGAAGGGKSHALRWDAYQFCLMNPGLQAYLFRRTLPELEDNHIKFCKREIPRELGTYNETRKVMEFANGSAIYFCYCEKEADVYRYLGAEMHYIGLDEASRMLESQIQLLRTRNRLGGFVPSPDYAHALPRFVMASNPGGPAHNFLKQTFLQSPPEVIFYDETLKNPSDPEDKGWPSIFIPAKMQDNRFIDRNYEASFSGLPPELARAYRDGDWDAVVGQALHTLSRDRHQLRAFEPPKHWTRFMSLDWGSAKPFSVGWYVVSEGGYLKGREGWPDRYLPVGAVIRYAEWYGWNGRANQGIRLDSPAVARRILEMESERGEVLDYRIADSEIWSKSDGPSTAERMMEVDPRFALRPAKKDRKHNYSEVLARLAGNPMYMENGSLEEHPMFFATENCRHFWRTVPPLSLDETDPEKGPDTTLEDHCLVGDTLVLTPEGERRIDDLPATGTVWTRDGWAEFINLGCTARNVEIWRLTLENGMAVEATPSHQFLCSDGQYRRLDELGYACYISVSNQGDGLWHNTSTDWPIGSAASTGSARASGFIAWCGSTLTALFRRASTFITSTATAITTTSPIWSCFRPAPICATTQTSPSISSMPSGTWNSACAPRQLNGTGQMRAGAGIPSAAGSTPLFRRVLRLFAKSAGSGRCTPGASGNTALAPVSSELSAVAIRAIERASSADVFNLHVPGAHNFAVNGGVIVHNCYDELAYALRSRPFVMTKEDRWEEENREYLKSLRSVDPYATR